MGFYCPTCGEDMGPNPFFALTGQAMCFICETIVDLTNALRTFEAALAKRKEFEKSLGPLPI